MIYVTANTGKKPTIEFTEDEINNLINELLQAKDRLASGFEEHVIVRGTIMTVDDKTGASALKIAIIKKGTL